MSQGRDRFIHVLQYFYPKLQSYCPGQNLCCLKYQKTYKVSKSPIMNINLDNSTKNTDFEK